MNKVWICLIVLHGCASEHIMVKGYRTEVECNAAIKRANGEAGLMTDVQGQCESADALLWEGQKHE